MVLMDPCVKTKGLDTHTNVACITTQHTGSSSVVCLPLPPVEVGASEVGWREIVLICAQSATWSLAIGCLSQDMCIQLYS